MDDPKKKPGIVLGVFGGLALFFIGLPLAIIILPVLIVLLSLPAVQGFIVVVVLISLCLWQWRLITKAVSDFVLKIRFKRTKPEPLVSRPYFFSVDGEDSGPHSLEEMRRFRESGSLTDETLVIRLGDKEWQPASMFTELFF